MNRPLSVTILGWIYIAVGAITFGYQFAAIRGQPPFQYGVVGAELLRLAALVSGVYILRGQNWARWLALAWIGIHVAISAFHAVLELAVHTFICASVAFFLFRPTATRYFRPTRSEGVGR
jgi:predicted tellurium resistance membrane protein TerC